MPIPNNSVLKSLETSLNDAIRLYLGINRHTSSLGSVPYGDIVFNAVVQRFSDASFLDPVYRGINLDLVAIALTVRIDDNYDLVRGSMLNASETLLGCLRILRSGGISGMVDGIYLTKAFAGLTLLDNSISIYTTESSGGSIECTASINIQHFYEYTDLSEVETFWGAGSGMGGQIIPPGIGGSSSSSFSINIPLIGVIDGSNATFTTPQAFIPETLEVYWQGQLQTIITDYINVGNGTIQMTLSPPIGSVLVASYWINY